MPLKVRLTPEAASALQAEAERSGRSQQEIVQEAVSRYLSIGDDAGVTSERALARAAQSVHAARVTYRKVTPPTAAPFRNNQPRTARSRRPLLMRFWWC